MTSRQFRRFLFIEGFGSSGLSFAYLAVSDDDTGLFAILLYGILFLLLGIYLFIMSKKVFSLPSPKSSLYPFSFFGKWISLFFLLRYFINACFLTCIFAQSIHEIYTPEQSTLFLLLPLVAVICFLSTSSLQNRGRFLELTFLWIVIPFLIILFTSVLYLQDRPAPLFHNTLSSEIFTKSFSLLLCSSPIEFLFFIFPVTKTSYWSSDTKWVSVSNIFLPLIGIFLSNLFLWFCTVATIGHTLTKSTPWSVVKLIQLIHLPGGFLLRSDILLIIYWILCMLNVISGYLFFGCEIFSANFEFFQQKKRKYFLLLIPVLCILLFGTNVSKHFDKMCDIYRCYKIALDFPLLLLSPVFIYYRRKRKTARHKKCFILLCLCVCLSLNGCSMATNVEDRSYISSMYVTFQKNQYVFTMAQNQLEQEEPSEYIPCKLLTLSATSFEELQKIFQSRYSKVPEWNHIDAIFISDTLYENQNKFLEFLADWDKHWQCSPDVSLILTEHTPKDIYHLSSLPKGAAGSECKELIKQKSASHKAIITTPIEYIKSLEYSTNQQKLYRLFIQNGQLVLVMTNSLHFH